MKSLGVFMTGVILQYAVKLSLKRLNGGGQLIQIRVPNVVGRWFSFYFKGVNEKRTRGISARRNVKSRPALRRGRPFTHFIILRYQQRFDSPAIIHCFISFCNLIKG
jgi:hypothetical protein